MARTANTSSIYFDHLEGEALVIALDLRGLATSGGSACMSGATDPSHVLVAMGVTPKHARASIRFSLSKLSTDEDVDEALEIVPAAVARLRELAPVNAGTLLLAAMGADEGVLRIGSTFPRVMVGGSGTVLLLFLINAVFRGAGDAASYDRIAAFLVAHYTVVTYDRRGYSRSPLGDPQQLLGIETHSDDVHHLLAAPTGGPAFATPRTRNAAALLLTPARMNPR